MRFPGKKQLEGLSVVLSLAEADVSVDPERWPATHDVHRGLAYLRHFVGVERAKHGDKQRNSKRRSKTLRQLRALKRAKGWA